eukprot:UN10320
MFLLAFYPSSDIKPIYDYFSGVELSRILKRVSVFE